MSILTPQNSLLNKKNSYVLSQSSYEGLPKPPPYKFYINIYIRI